MDVTYRFDEVKAKAKRRGKCPICQRTTQRSRTFYATINPFNRNIDGTVKTLSDVLQSVEQRAAAWQPEPRVFTHDACRQASGASLRDPSDIYGVSMAAVSAACRRHTWREVE